MMRSNLEVSFILILALGMLVTLGWQLSLIERRKRPAGLGRFGVIVILGGVMLVALMERDKHAYEVSKGTSHAQGLEWAGIDGWARPAIFAIGIILVSFAFAWRRYIALDDRRRKLSEAPVVDAAPPAQLVDGALG